MKDQEKLKLCFEKVIWMAIRYAHGRSTYAPSEVRDAINKFKEVFPDWELKDDHTIKPPEEGGFVGAKMRGDFLDDLFKHTR